MVRDRPGFDRVLVAHTSPCGSLVEAGRFSRSTMWKTAFYAYVLLLSLIGEQLSPSRLMKIVRGFLVRNGKGATTGWIESMAPVYLASDCHSLLPEFPSALFAAGYSVVQAQNAAQGENRYT